MENSSRTLLRSKRGFLEFNVGLIQAFCTPRSQRATCALALRFRSLTSS